MRLHAALLLPCLLLVLVRPAAAQCPPYRAGQAAHPAREEVFYQIFVRSFADSDGDGIGDFRGLTEKLDYLNDGDPGTDTDLGVTALWLMPVTQSPSYHGYDTTDYDRVEQDYGTDEDFAHFLREAHRRGMGVIIDLVVNHCSAEHPWFKEAASSTQSPRHDWFIWRTTNPGWKQPWSNHGTWHHWPRLGLYYYGLFWGGMPDLNYESPDVRQEMIAIARRWMHKGVDGFRLDASRHIIEAGVEEKAAGSPETHQWWREFAAAVRGEFPHALLVGENWTSIAEVADYFGERRGEQLDMSFNFELSGALVQGLGRGDPEPVRDALCEVARRYPAHALDGTFLTNHDMVRVMTQLGGDEAKARLGAALLLTLPGVPFLYYGEEIGLKNGPGGADEEKRTPMQWTPEGGFTTGKPWRRYQDDLQAANVQTQRADPGSLWNLYRRLIHLRLGRAALAYGRYAPLAASSDKVLAFERTDGHERLLVVANFGAQPLGSVEVELPEAAPRREALFQQGTGAVLEGKRVGPLPAHGLAVFQL
jgi:alpha-amylase